MDKKKILILCFAFFVLLVGLFVAVKSINEKNKKTSSPQKTIAEKKEVNVSSKQDAAVSIMGSIGAIDEKTLSIRQMREVVSVNINSSIVVSNVDLDGKKLGAAKLSDLKTGDSVRVTYDGATKNATEIFVTRVQAQEK
ncbi:MAG: hypothetical protein WCO05_00015 [Candidatus Moraniibacteriota bacterium]